MKKTMFLLSSLVAAATTGSVFAAEDVANSSVQIIVKGTVVASPCESVNDGKAQLEVPLGDIQATALSTAGSQAVGNGADGNFSLKFTGCPLGTDNITAEFSGDYDTENGGWRNTAATPAGNTAVRLYQQSDLTAPIVNLGTVTTSVNTADGTASFDLNAKAISLKGSATPGNIESVIVASFTYQ